MTPPTPPRPETTVRRSPGEDGFTLLEVVIAVTIFLLIVAGIGAVITLEADVLGQAADDRATFLEAAGALERIRNEMKSAVQQPKDLTIAPAYAISATSFTFREPEAPLAKTDPNYSALKATGRVTSNDVLYAPYAKTIAYDAAAGTVTLTRTGTLRAGMPSSEVIARSVVDFAFFDGESKAVPPAAPTVDSWVIGVRIVVRRPSTSAGRGGADVDSSLGGIVLATKVLIPPETLVNTKSKPMVGP